VSEAVSSLYDPDLGKDTM